MTEREPLGTVNHPKAKHAALAGPAREALREKQGRPPFGIDLRIAGDDGAALPHDGTTFGDLQARGHWVVERYFRGGDALDGGWRSPPATYRPSTPTAT